MKKSFEINFNWKKHFTVYKNVIQQKEHSEIEFKQSFQSPKYKDKKLHKWIASFANANGGLIIYGVKNNGEIVGLKNNNLKDFDNKDLSQELLKFFAPKIDFELFIKEVGDVELGFLYVYMSEEKPVIAINSASNTIREGDIFYRYSGQSKHISYGDLRNIIEEKSNRLNERWMQLINDIATIGVENVGLLNIESGELLGSKNRLLISEELIDKISFINEGHFVEKEGAPALKLIGEVVPIDSNKAIKLVEKHYQIITQRDLYKAFLDQNLDSKTAIEFFRKVTYENTVYFPIYYYLLTSGLSLGEIENKLQEKIGHKFKNLKERYLIEKDDYCRFQNGNINTGTNAARNILHNLELLRNKTDIDIKKMELSSLRYLIQAITHLTYEDIDKLYILDVLNKIFDYHFTQANGTKTLIRQGFCHVDLLLFGKTYFDKIT